MAEKIDPGLVQLARENPLRTFVQGGLAITWTSTCELRPVVSPAYTRKDYTPLLYASIAAENTRLIIGSTLNRAERLEELSDLYGRDVRSIETALSSIPKST